jgi:hypothetical protein
MQNREEAKKIGLRMMNRAVTCFSIQHLTDIFYDTLIDIMQNRHDPLKEDMTVYKVDESGKE